MMRDHLLHIVDITIVVSTRFLNKLPVFQQIPSNRGITKFFNSAALKRLNRTDISARH